MKGEIKKDHVGLNKYQLQVLGIPIPLTFIEVSPIISETTTVELPDRTQASGGEELPGEFTAMMPLHHSDEMLHMEAWFQQARAALPGYKRGALMNWKTVSDQRMISRPIYGLFPSRREDPPAEMANDGEQANVTWTFKFDSAPSHF